ncbi:MAG: sigma 54-interacting transcriptional regulator [Deltaproteobacteria bacterium]|nr:sigma 54-interacting transcriptional regulator [Deltaproteobacteria bacterium]
MRILIVDDEESIRFTFKSFLSKAGYETLTAKDYTSALKVIAGVDLDLIFADIILGGRTGIDILNEVKKRDLQCPVIIITGEPNIETATDAVRLGAFDYMPKPVRKETLLRITAHALRHKSLLDSKKKLEAENKKYRLKLEAIFKSLQDAIITIDNKMRIINANAAAKRICGLLPSEIIEKQFTEVAGQCSKSCFNVLKETLETRSTIQERRIECRHQDRPGQVVLLTSSPLVDQAGNFIGAILVIRDITKLTDLERKLKQRHQFHNIIGKNENMQKLYRLLEDLADTETTVLITGATGTGKELIAKALHYEGTRAAKPLITINCSVLSENLLESELFGHIKGAFTNAVKDKTGRFQMADGGTIFLDEIGDISPRIQLKLLRFLQEKEFERVGDSKTIKVDARVIAATNLDLREKVRLGEFREDLYYRLKVIEVALPSLEQKREDIPLLVNHFKDMFNKKFNKDIDDISSEALTIFMRYPWPGNVRELEHAIEHAFVLCHDRTIMVDHLPSEIQEYSRIKNHTPEKRSVDEPQEILRALKKTGWNKAKAARLLGMSRQTIYRKINEYKLTKPTEVGRVVE